MNKPDAFEHSAPALYDRYMGPLLFEPYARVVAERALAFHPARILEIAAGTGILTAALHRALPAARIVATDINAAMLAFAAQRVSSPNVTFQPADALALPFADNAFDLIICQFGVMFFPDKIRANREARRVLTEGGHYIFVTFDSLDRNLVPRIAEEAASALFPNDPLTYMERGPFSYSVPEVIEKEALAAGFTAVALETVALGNQVSAHDAAHGIVMGSPFRGEIERRDPAALPRALAAVTAALAQWDGKAAPMSAHVVTATK